MNIHDILDAKLLAEMLSQGYVKMQTHPTLPYGIYNYTAKTQYENVWNDVTEQCRGLIVNTDTNVIIARPFRKFFNYGQPGAPQLNLDAKVHVTDKADGSLGILYPAPGRTPSGWAIATRGSFTSEQAIHATKLFNERYASRWAPYPGYTFLFEIVYPGNRIVLDYGKLDDLLMITAISNITGTSIPRAGTWSAWPGPVVQSFEYSTLADALMATPRDGAEGLVVHFTETDHRVKIKQDDYLAIHRAIFGMSARVIWSYMAVNACRSLMKNNHFAWDSRLGIDPKRAKKILDVGDDWAGKLIANMPDEFYAWFEITMNRIQREVIDLERYVELKFHTYAAEARVDGKFDRAKMWRAVRTNEGGHISGMIMSHLDGANYTPALWRCVKPKAELPFKNMSEDVA